MFVKKFLLVLAVMVSANAWAGLPMAKKPFVSSQDFANRLASGKGMNATAEEYAAAYQDYHPGALSGVKYMEEYAQNLEMVSCPQGVLYRLKSVENRGGRHLGEITRMFRPGEQCFKDRNIGEIVQSASCGNVAVAAEKEVPPQQTPIPQALVQAPVQQPQGCIAPEYEIAPGQCGVCRDKYGQTVSPELCTSRPLPSSQCPPGYNMAPNGLCYPVQQAAQQEQGGFCADGSVCRNVVVGVIVGGIVCALAGQCFHHGGGSHATAVINNDGGPVGGGVIPGNPGGPVGGGAISGH
ncbi:MAG: hypothetical protein ACYC8S_02050 [Minisyncoccota bacterium]